MKTKLSLLVILFPLLVSCSDPKPADEEEASIGDIVTEQEPKSEPADGKQTNLEGNDYLVTISTNLGEMKAILYD